MNSVGKLGDIVPSPVLINAGELGQDFRQTGEFLCAGKEFVLDWLGEGNPHSRAARSAECEDHGKMPHSGVSFPRVNARVPGCSHTKPDAFRQTPTGYGN